MYKKLKNKVFAEILETMTLPNSGSIQYNENIVKSISEFIALIAEIINTSKDNYNISDVDMLIPVEQYPRELLWKINNGQESITSDSKKQLTIVTYNIKEVPGQIGAHKVFSDDGIRNIKPRLLATVPDEKYDGYSKAITGKVIDATVDFLVWGLEDKGIRDRSFLLRKIIQDNTWYLKYKGIREIIWLGATENDTFDQQNIIKSKKETYKVTYTEIQEIRQKNIEQIIIRAGISND